MDEIKKEQGISLLVHFLHERPPDAATEAELTACEHVQQKAAIALSRLCREPSNAKLVVSYKGKMPIALCLSVALSFSP